ncbi:Uu.00g013080.m01.CDS01 [Anthostomella pinea]|uniref:Uu.00g013080.m01.CDS01 n=1 Tax=Anthostomella pinea TaxID=933095 RepID=A0AAI8YQ52_9PEZI|nr:Uu.00g013080.m01.CDS01 [Anthostomella pinea]
MSSAQQDPQSAKVASLPSITFLPCPDTNNHPDWNKALNSHVTGIWLLFLKNSTSSTSARGWVIGLVTASGQALHIYPKQTPYCSTTAIICTPACGEADSVPSKSFTKMLEASTKHFARAAMPGAKVGYLLLTLQRAGIMNYGLREGRGTRFWLCAAIFVLRQFIKEPRSFDLFGDCVIEEMSLCSTDDEQQKKQETQEKQITSDEIKKGQAVVHKWSKQGIKALKECNQRMERFVDLMRLV